MKTHTKPLIWLLLMGIAAISKAWAAVPPAPKGFTADAKGSPSTITLQWTAATGLTGYELHRSTDNKTFTKVADPAATASSYSDTPLQPNTTYYYKLYAVNKDGKSTAVDANAKTAAPLAKPAVPKNLSANSPSSTQIDLNWETGDGGGAPDSFDWQCSTDKTFARVDKSGNTAAKNTNISGLTPNTLYYLRVRAKNNAGESGWSGNDEQRTQAPPKPATPNNFRVANADQDNINVAWDAVSGAEGYEVRIATNSGFSPELRKEAKNSSMTTHTFGQLSPSTTYYMQVRAKNTVSGVDTWSDWSATKEQRTTAQPILGVPNNLDGTAISTSQLDFKWSSTSVAIAGETFDWECSTDKTFGKVEQKGNTGTKNVSVMNLNAGTKYYFRVRAKDKSNESNWAGAIDRDTKAPDKPAAPTNLRTANITYNGVDLAWDNTVPDAKPIEIERKVGTGNFVLLKSVDGGVLSYKDSDVQPRTTYTYRVKNIKGGVASDYSNERTVTTPAPPAPSEIVATQMGVNASGKPIVKITWKSNWPQATVFEVQRSENQNSGFGKVDRKDFGNQFIDEKNTECGKTYYYRVIANLGLTDSDPSGSSNVVNTICQAAKPATPTNLRTTVVIYNRIDLAWNNAVSDANETILERKTGAGSFSPLTSFPNGTRLTYQDDNINPRTTYVYRVRIKKSGIESDNSNELTVTTPAPPAPSEVVATQTGVNASGKPIIKITWKNNWPQATVFEIQRSENQSSGYGKIDRNDFRNQFIDEKNTECGKTYYYRVIANLGLTDSDPSGASNALNTVCQPVKPATPTNLRTTVVIYNRIDLAWNNAVTDANETILERKTGAGSFSPLTSFPNGTRLTYQDDNINPRTTYVYRVRIKKDGVESDNSNELTVTTPAPPAPSEVVAVQTGVNASGKPIIKITWKNNWPQATVFEVQRSENQNSGYGKIDRNDFGNQFVDEKNTECGKTYYYRVIANLGLTDSDPSGPSNVVNTVCQPVKPATPTNLRTTVVIYNRIDLAWNNVVSDANETILERKTETGSFSPLATFPNGTRLTYQDGNVSPRATYVYRVRIKKGGVESDNSNELSVTTPAPPAPTEVLTSLDGFSGTDANSNARIIITWRNNWPEATSSILQRSTEPNSGFTNVNTNVGLGKWLDPDVPCGKTYYYRVISTLANVQSDPSASSVALPAPCRVVTIPVAPTNLTAVASGSDKIVLKWTNNSSNESGFEIERASSEAGPFVKIGEVNADIKTYTDGELVSSTNYCYQVKAKNSAGSSTYSNKSCAKTDAPAITLPSAPTSLTTSASGSDKIVLTWTDNANNESGFEIERASSEAGPFSKIGEVNADIKTYTDGVLVSSTQYCYQVKAKNSAGSSSYSNKSCAKTDALAATIPFAPSSLTAAASGSDKIALTWTDNSSNESGFEIERASSEAGPFVKIGEVNADIKTYTDGELVSSTNYCYQVKAKNSAGSSTYSNKSCAKTDAPTVTLPFAPTSLTTSASGSDKIVLTWTDNANNESGFDIERATSEAGPFLKIGEVNTDIKTYTDGGLMSSTQYCYQVKAKNSAGSSSYSNKSCAKTDVSTVTLPVTPTSLTATASGSDKIVLAWTDNASNESGFDIERASSEAGPFVKIAEVNTDIKNYTDGGLSSASNYCYQVKAKNSAGSSTYSNKSCAKTDMITTPISALAAPKALRQDLSKITINQVSMVWDNVATNATGVEIWRSVGDESNWQLYEAINTNPIPAAYTDKSVRTGNKYLYKVRATRTNGDPSDWSNTINLLAPVVNSIIPHTEVKIYPNPFNGYIQLDLGRFSKASIYVFNNSGIKVFEKLKNHSNSQILDLQQLSVGSYWLVVINETEKQTFKIIKQ